MSPSRYLMAACGQRCYLPIGLFQALPQSSYCNQHLWHKEAGSTEMIQTWQKRASSRIWWGSEMTLSSVILVDLINSSTPDPMTSTFQRMARHQLVKSDNKVRLQARSRNHRIQAEHPTAPSRRPLKPSRSITDSQRRIPQ